MIVLARAALRWLALTVSTASTLCMFALAALAEEESIEAYDARIRAELEAIAPGTVETFDAANAAREGGDWAAAAEGYAAVVTEAPTYVHAVRRLCGVQVRLGDRADAIANCRRAVGMDALAENRVALASALVERADESAPPPSLEEIGEATRLVDDALAERPEMRFAHYVSCRIAFDREDLERLGHCSAALRRLEPDAPLGWYAGAVHSLSMGETNTARELAAGAEARGVPREALAGMIASIDDLEYEQQGGIFGVAWSWAKIVVPAWLGGFAVLIALGFVLSRATLASASKAPTGRSAEVKGSDRSLRRLYGAVLWLTCVYFYLSLPLVLLAVVGAAAGLIYGFLAVGRIPIKFALIVVILAAVTVWAALKGLLAVFAKGSDQDPGSRVDLSEHPKLKAVLTEVAEKIGTRPVDNVYLEPTTNIAVMERGGNMAMGHGSERCLILGVGALDGMRLGPFKAILAHEYGHFQNEDTAGGGFALAVRRSLYSMAASMAQHGAAAWYNPAWLFLNGFHWVFLRTSQGASRLQEILADRWAALAYGSSAFADGLTHVIRRSIEFDAHVDASLKDVVDRRVSMSNLYTHEPAERIAPDQIEDAFAKAFDRAPSPFDSHPAPKDRIRWVEALHAAGTSSGDDAEAMAWTLFSDRERIQLSMTREVRENVLANHGIDIGRPRSTDDVEPDPPTDGEPSAPAPA